MYTVRIFMKCTHVCGPKSLLTLYQIINKPDVPSLADEIAEPRPDMNIKVAAFTVSETSINTIELETILKIFAPSVDIIKSQIACSAHAGAVLCRVH